MKNISNTLTLIWMWMFTLGCYLNRFSIFWWGLTLLFFSLFVLNQMFVLHVTVIGTFFVWFGVNQTSVMFESDGPIIEMHERYHLSFFRFIDYITFIDYILGQHKISFRHCNVFKSQNRHFFLNAFACITLLKTVLNAKSFSSRLQMSSSICHIVLYIAEKSQCQFPPKSCRPITHHVTSYGINEKLLNNISVPHGLFVQDKETKIDW